MSNKKELTTAESMDLLYRFGTKCYKKGYRRAYLEVLVGFGYVGAVLGIPVLYCYLKDLKKESEE